MLALQHYTSEEDFHDGLHCEGSLPVTLFAVFFWDELYNVAVPGAFVSPYQEAPLDLFTAEFFPNRKENIEEKMKFIRALDLESFTDWMQERWSNYNQYRSVMSNTLFKDEHHFKVFTFLNIYVVCRRQSHEHSFTVFLVVENWNNLRFSYVSVGSGEMPWYNWRHRYMREIGF